MTKYEIVHYDDKYRLHLAYMLQNMSTELYGTGMVDVDSFVKNHAFIYLLLVDEKPVGLSSWSTNHYFGLRNPTLGNTYLYVDPEYRNGKANYILSGVIFCKVSAETNMPIEAYIASESSRRMLSHRVKGKFLYDVYEYSPEEVKKAFDNLKKYTNYS